MRRPVPLVPQALQSWGTEWGTPQTVATEQFVEPVPLVPHVPLRKYNSENEMGGICEAALRWKARPAGGRSKVGGNRQGEVSRDRNARLADRSTIKEINRR